MILIYPSPVFGPIKSRRLGISLGINIMPSDGKWCSFDCVYCECGLNKDHNPKASLPTVEEVSSKLEDKLKEMKENGDNLDTLTFSGNGEPTMHPEFHIIADEVIKLRDIYYPQAKVSVLSNSTQIHRKNVRDALMKVDNAIMKLDTVSPEYINTVNRPAGKYEINEIVENLSKMNGKVIIQTMFMKGNIMDNDGNMVSVDNCKDEYIIPYIKALRKINPESVMIYTLDRKWPTEGLKKSNEETMNEIAAKIREAGFITDISY